MQSYKVSLVWSFLCVFKYILHLYALVSFYFINIIFSFTFFLGSDKPRKRKKENSFNYRHHLRIIALTNYEYNLKEIAINEILQARHYHHYNERSLTYHFYCRQKICFNNFKNEEIAMDIVRRKNAIKKHNRNSLSLVCVLNMASYVSFPCYLRSMIRASE